METCSMLTSLLRRLHGRGRWRRLRRHQQLQGQQQCQQQQQQRHQCRRRQAKFAGCSGTDTGTGSGFGCSIVLPLHRPAACCCPCCYRCWSYALPLIRLLIPIPISTCLLLLWLLLLPLLYRFQIPHTFLSPHFLHFLPLSHTFHTLFLLLVFLTSYAVVHLFSLVLSRSLLQSFSLSLLFHFQLLIAVLKSRQQKSFQNKFEIFKKFSPTIFAFFVINLTNPVKTLKCSHSAFSLFFSLSHSPCFLLATHNSPSFDNV